MAEALTPHLPSLLWWVPLLPLLAGGIIAFLPNRRGRIASRLAIGALFVSCLIALAAFVCTLAPAEGEAFRLATSLTWFTFGDVALKVGLVLDPMSAAMAAMVTFVAFWIFIYSIGYMEKEARFGRFFGFLSLFCGAMLMVVLSNSLLLLFMAWELVGLASYMLIGFYFEKPSAAAAAQKAFITTRVGDMAFFLGMIWLYRQSGTLLFYDHGNGLLESGALASLAGTTTIGGLTVSAAAALLLLVGAMGKSGQVPLHTWLPDAMEGPTPVSALIHAATMVAAGVFLVARTHPIFANRRRPDRSSNRRGVDRRHHRALCRAGGARADRHQAHPRLLDGLAARLHDGGARHRRGGGGDVPPDRPRVFQGAAVPFRRLGDPRLPRGTGHPPDGRPARGDAEDLRHLCGRHDGAVRIPVRVLRILEQGGHPAQRQESGPAATARSCWPPPPRC